MHPGIKGLIGLAVVAALAGGGGYAYMRLRGDNSSNPDQLVLYGNVDIREADLAFNIAGRVASMLVEEGDKVKKGELLATLETEIYDADVEAAKADVGAQKAALDRLLAGSRPEEIRKARENAQAIQAQLADARATLKRTEQLASDRFAPLQQLDADQARVNNLEALLRASQQELSMAVQGPRTEDITQARAQLRASQAQLLLALRRLDYTRLYAKEAGVINTRIVEPGAVVQANTPVYTVALTDPVWVRSYVDEPDLGRIHSGTKAEIFSEFKTRPPLCGLGRLHLAHRRIHAQDGGDAAIAHQPGLSPAGLCQERRRQSPARHAGHGPPEDRQTLDRHEVKPWQSPTP